ncbi:MAG TPA: glycoside hydrolase family 2 TIM barrel-domain containing protein, partial [Kofleriaceae bacterium]|nr:glycoside hydrolase family 2 TIM barrel-domain containing protein [Kofleriaceae bacterium]
GEVPDPYFGRNSLFCEWVPERTWIYRKRFRVETDAARVQLRFEGVDHAARYFLNGEQLGASEGMFRPVAFEIGERLREENLVSVVIDRAPDCEPQVGRTARVRIHKSRMGYGWDFCPRMVHQGIWDDVLLHASGPVRIEDVWVRPVLSADLTRAEVQVEIHTSGAAGTAEVMLRAGQHTVAAGTADLVDGRALLSFDLERPAIWWPNGSGPQPLYDAEVRVRDASARDSDRRSVVFGVRRVEMAPNDDPAARPYTFVVNGRRMYICGWNWVPIDACYGPRRDGKLDHLLGLARRAHVNLLRVWGGGLIERADFYQRCDRLGLMVWQEFSLSSSGIESKPSEEPAYLRALAADARAIVPRRRNHPSLVLWCGGNELKTSDGRPVDDEEPAVAVLKDVVRELDPDRAWLPTSPSSDQEVHGPWEHQGPAEHYRLYDRSTALLASEFGVEGMTNRRALEGLIPAHHRWPTGRENRVYFHLGAWWNNEPLVQQSFGGFADLDALRRASQFLQADGLRYAIEANRRRMGQNSGSIPWQMNESYPNAWCTSAIDYRGQPKPAYHAVRRAYAPLLVCARFDGPLLGGVEELSAELWLVVAPEVEAHPGCELLVQLGDAEGAIHADARLAAAVVPGAARAVGKVTWAISGVPDEAVLLLELSLADRDGGPRLAHNRYLLCGGRDLSALRKVPATELAASVERGATTWHLNVTNRGRHLALGIDLEEDGPPGRMYIEDSGFSLMPGEARSIDVEWREVPAGERRIRVSAWNAAELHLE